MFNMHIRELEAIDQELDNITRSIDRLDTDMVKIQQEITECVLAEKINKEGLAELKQKYKEIKDMRTLELSDLDENKDKMRQVCRHLDQLVEGIRK